MLFLLWLLALCLADDSIIKGPKGLHEFIPIRNTIVQSQLQEYLFNVNTLSGLGQYYEFLIFLSGNICLEPADRAASAFQLLTVYYSFNASMFSDFELGQMAHFLNGYFQALADVSVSQNSQTTLYIAVRAPESTNTTDQWSYQIGVSQNDLVFQWDNRAFALVVDTDHESALIVTGDITTNLSYDAELDLFNLLNLHYQLFVYSLDQKDYFSRLNQSWCAVRNGPALLSIDNFQSEISHRGGGSKQQFYVPGLNASTLYVAYLLADFGGLEFGGTVYRQFEFETLDYPACRLLYNLDFCSEVAYLAPISSKPELKDFEALGSAYDDHARGLYENFSKALQQVACNTTPDAIFSPVRTCDDCARLYKNWLCAVTIPRCTTFDLGMYTYRENASRSDFVNDEILPPLPYYEIMPCLNVCQLIARDCPADFGFKCPRKPREVELSYFWDLGFGDIPSCNFVGIPSLVNAAGRLGFSYWHLLLLLIFV